MRSRQMVFQDPKQSPERTKNLLPFELEREGKQAAEAEATAFPDGVLLLGSAVIQPRRLSVTNGHGTKKVEHQAMRVLLALARHSQRVVTREELLQEAWPDVIVSDDSLSRAVSLIRKALEDHPEDSRYIQTVPKVGYRLIPVPEWKPGVGVMKSYGGLGRRWMLVALVMGAGALILGLTFARQLPWQDSETSRENQPEVAEARISSLPGIETDPVFSPDGKWILFTHTPSGAKDSDIFVTTDDGSDWRAIVSTPGVDHSPSWAPDGSRFAWMRQELINGNQVCTIVAVNLLNPTVEQVIGECFDWKQQSLLWWTEKSMLMTGGAGEDGLYGRGLERLDIDTGTRIPVTFPPLDSIGDFVGRTSKNGYVAFIRSRAGARDTLHVLDPKGTTRQVSTGDWSVFGLDWTPSGDALVVSGSPIGEQRGIWILSLEDDQIEMIASVHSDSVTVSPAGSVVYTASTTNIDTYVLSDPSSSSPKLVEPLVSSTSDDEYPTLRPSKNVIALVSSRDGHPQIWTIDLADQSWTKTTNLRATVVERPVWTGDTIWFAADGDIYSVDTKDRRVTQRTTNPAADRDPVVLPNGDLVFASNRSGKWNLWLYKDNGEPRQITETGGYFPSLRPDGAWLYFQKWSEAGIWRVRADALTDPAELVSDIWVLRANWLPLMDGSIVWYRSGRVWYEGSDGSAAREVTALPTSDFMVAGMSHFKNGALAIAFSGPAEADLFRRDLSARAP